MGVVLRSLAGWGEAVAGRSQGFLFATRGQAGRGGVGPRPSLRKAAGGGGMGGSGGAVPRVGAPSSTRAGASRGTPNGVGDPECNSVRNVLCSDSPEVRHWQCGGPAMSTAAKSSTSIAPSDHTSVGRIDGLSQRRRCNWKLVIPTMTCRTSYTARRWQVSGRESCATARPQGPLGVSATSTPD